MKGKAMKKVKIKAWDIIIIGLLLIISFLPYAFLKQFVVKEGDQLYAYISVSGKPYKEIPLTGQVSHKEMVIETEFGNNTIVIENESIAVIDADCSDHVCEKFGFRSKPGEYIACLPHELYIEVRGKMSQQGSEVDAGVS